MYKVLITRIIANLVSLVNKLIMPDKFTKLPKMPSISLQSESEIETSFDIFPSKSSIYPKVIDAFQKNLIVALNNGSCRK